MKRELAIVVAVLAFLSLIPLADLFHPGLPLTHDGPDHVARIANFYQSLSEGKIVPRWAGNLNWAFGHPILMFLYPLPSYLASLFHWVGFSLVDSTKWVLALAYLTSVLAMYAWLSAVFGRLSAFVGAILYGFAPYRFVDLYVRGAIGEHLAFVFPPLICWGLLLLARRARPLHSVLLVSLGTAGLLLSHNALSLMFLPLIVLYGIYLFIFEVSREARSRFAGLTSYFLLLGFFLSAFFWVPAFFEGKYTMRDIVTKGEFADRFVAWQWFFSSSWNYGGGNEFSKEIGILHWLGVVVAAFFLLASGKMEKGITWVVRGLLVVFFILLFLMTASAKPVWDSVTILQKFQFPWRLLSVSVFVSSVLGGIVVSQLSKKFAIFASILVIFVSLVFTHGMWKAKDFLVKPESFYTGIYPGTTDTGESSPIWSVRFMEKEAIAPYEIIEGKGIILPLLRTSTRHVFSVEAQRRARVVDNTLYFPGWNVLVDGRELDRIRDLIYQDPNYRGLMTFWVEPGKHSVEVVFGETKLRKVSNYLSITGLLLLIATVTIGKPLLWRKFR